MSPDSMSPDASKPASRNSAIDLLAAGSDPSQPLEVAAFSRWSIPPSSKADVGLEGRPSQLPPQSIRPASTGSWAPAPAAQAPLSSAGSRSAFGAAYSPSASPAVAAPLPPMAPAEPESKRMAIWIGLGVVVLGLAAAALFFVLRPTVGSLTITVSGPQREALSKLEVFVDGKSVCKTSTCKVPEVSAGNHTIRAEAPGYTAVEQSVTVQAGSDLARDVMFAAVAAKTVLNVLGVSSLTLQIDGKALGALPKEFVELTPGSHEILISGGTNYLPHKEQLTLSGGETRVVGPVVLKVAKGKVVLSAGPSADGAKVALDGQPVTLPATLELTADQPHQLTAEKKGFEPFSTSISFADGNAERRIAIDLVEKGKAASAAASEPRTATRPTTPAAPQSKTPASSPAESPAPAAAAAAANSQATLNINSIPASSVLINGRPVGLTPKLGVSVAPGSVTVTFIHPEQGRKTVAIDVAAGATKTVTVRFP
jgi:serine/threonine-protein kinase